MTAQNPALHKQQEVTPLDLVPLEQEAGVLAALLLNQGIITEKQLNYALRVRKKIATPQTMLDTLIELGYVERDQVKESLRNSQINIRLGDLLVELGYLTDADLRQALGLQKDSGGKKRIGEILIEGGFIEERRLLETLSYQLGFPVVTIDFGKLDKVLANLIPHNVCKELCLLPIEKDGDNIVVAFGDPLDQQALQTAERLLGKNFKPAITSKSTVLEALSALEQTSAQAYVAADENTIIGIINTILDDAIDENASDIHIEPMDNRLRIRFRRDGVMQHYKDFPRSMAPQLSTRIKVLGQADIAEKRRHQDARILFKSRKHGVNLDLRVSIFVTIYGEKIVLRLLSNKASLLDIKEIGMAPRMLENFIYNAVETPTGVVIITGPTGSGKTSTLYSCINFVNDIHTSIITAEDPVEIVLDGVCQCSINPKIGVTFEETLRHIVRQDPDIIVLGEVRDKFSAETAIEAALTGHKVFTTFHTEDSIGALTRLLTMQVEPFLIASTITCIVAQRLMRRICPACAEPYTPSPLDLSRMFVTSKDIAGAKFKQGRGCKACRFSGYKGRVGIFETLIMNENLSEAILLGKSSLEIRKLSIETAGLVTLFEDGLVKAAQGQVSVKEIITDLPKLGKPRPLSELHRILGVNE
ncbi:MAG: ATPase, T2SS/T4P/T4SS family [Geobacteraceae bacterium]|nr:ATPase, T2SS/T4P/T4SS family [Geobacteraceae bacterium]